MTVFITLTTTGIDTGPTFNLYSDVDGFTSAFETGVLKMDLIIGYASSLVPDGTTIIRVMSEGICTNYVDIPVALTTTTTTTIANPANSILTFSSYEAGIFEFTLSNPIYSTNVVIVGAEVSGSINVDCSTGDSVDNIDFTNPVTIAAGNGSGTSLGLTPFGCETLSVSKVNSIDVSGYGLLVDTDIITIDGTLVTIAIDNSCVAPYVCTPGKAISVKYGNSSGTLCISTFVTVYIQLSESFGPGVTIYTDSGLTTPLTAYSYISETGEIFNINSITGIVGSTTGTSCF